MKNITYFIEKNKYTKILLGIVKSITRCHFIILRATGACESAGFVGDGNILPATGAHGKLTSLLTFYYYSQNVQLLSQTGNP